MDDVKRKVLLDLFASPATLLPVAGGLTLLMASWATGGHGLFNFAGVAAILGGLGLLATRLIFGLERITDQAYQYVIEHERARQEAALEQLDEKLVQDRDPRTQTCLRRLRDLYSDLKNDIREGRVTSSSHRVVEGIDQMFHLCVEHLRRSYQLWEESRRLEGRAKQTVLQRRDQLVQEVEDSVRYVSDTIDRLHTLGGRQKKSELARLREELDESILAARRAEERLAEWERETKTEEEQ
jgi:hypothetical protein